MLFDLCSNQKLHLTWVSALFEICKERFKNIVLLKKDMNNLNTCDYIFVPLASVNDIKLSKFETVTGSHGLIEQLELLKTESLVNGSGFIVPLQHLDQAYFYGKNELIDWLNTNQNTANRILKARCIDWAVESIDDLFEIKELIFEHISRINYSFIKYGNSFIIETEVDLIENLISIEPICSQISIDHRLSRKEFKLVWELLCSRRTRFRLWVVWFQFNLLSEWLTALSLFANCPELDSVQVYYLSSDVENEHDIIENKVIDFRKKFGFIRELIINNIKH